MANTDKKLNEIKDRTENTFIKKVKDKHDIKINL